MKTRLLTLIIAMLATVAVSASELADSVGADTPAAAPAYYMNHKPPQSPQMGGMQLG